MLARRMLDAAAHRRAGGGGGGGFDPDAAALFARMSPAPDALLQADVDTCIRALKAGSNPWSALDALYLFATDDRANAVLNWVPGGASDAVEVGAPGWTANGGYTGSGSDWLQLAAVSELARFVDGTSGHVGAWSLSSAASATPLIRPSTEDAGSIYPRWTDDAAWAALMSDSGGYSLGPNATGAAEHYVVVRAAAAAGDVRLYKGGLPFGAAFGEAAAPLGGGAAFLTPGDTAGTAIGVAAAHVGGALGAQQVADLRDALHAYLAARGAV